jgi:hypothetical protein
LKNIWNLVFRDFEIFSGIFQVPEFEIDY